MQAESTDTFAAEYERRLEAWSDIQQHLPFLHDTTLSYEKPAVLELGCRSGNSTSAFLAAVYKASGKLVSVDIAPIHVPDWWAQHPGWTFIMSDDLAPKLIRQVAKLMPELDVLFIDTSHAYYHTLMELETWVPFVKPGGIVLMHDTEYDPAPVEVACVPQPKWPVAVALAEYCTQRGLKWENHTGCNGLGIIRIPDGG